MRKGKVFYNNEGRQEGTNGNPWSNLKFIEITIPNYDYNKFKELPNGNDTITRATEEVPGFSPTPPTYDKVLDYNYTTKIAFKGNLKFVERLKTTKKYYIYYKEYDNVGGGFALVDININRLFSIYHDGGYLYLCSYNENYNGEKIKLWYREV